MRHPARDKDNTVRIAGVDRSRAGIVFGSPPESPRWIVALVLKPSPDREWLACFEATLSRLADQHAIAFQHDLDLGWRRRPYYLRQKGHLVSRLARWIFGDRGIVLRVSCPGSPDQVTLAMAEARRLVDEVNSVANRNAAEESASRTAHAREVARFSEALNVLDATISGEGPVASREGDRPGLVRPEAERPALTEAYR